HHAGVHWARPAHAASSTASPEAAGRRGFCSSMTFLPGPPAPAAAIPSSLSVAPPREVPANPGCRSRLPGAWPQFSVLYSMAMKTMLSFGAFRAIAALPGCSGTGASPGPATYEVDVRNRTDQPIVAQVVAPLDGAPQVMRESRLGPGDRAQLLVRVNSNH